MTALVIEEHIRNRSASSRNNNANSKGVIRGGGNAYSNAAVASATSKVPPTVAPAVQGAPLATGNATGEVKGGGGFVAPPYGTRSRANTVATRDARDWRAKREEVRLI